MTNSFLPKSYEVSGGSGGNYMRFAEGENKLRIITSPLIGWEWWIDADGNVRERGARPQQGDKPVRVPRDGEVPAEAGDTVKEFWAMPVWNYQDGKIQILEITQKGIMRTIHSLAKDKEWGSPFNYDLNIVRTGEGLDTTYEVIPLPPKELAKEVQTEWETMKSTFDMKALFENGDPFGGVSTAGNDPSDLIS